MWAPEVVVGITDSQGLALAVDATSHITLYHTILITRILAGFAVPTLESPRLSGV